MGSEEQPRAPRDSGRQEAPLSQASHARGFSSESEGQLWCGCVAPVLARAIRRSARLCSLSAHYGKHLIRMLSAIVCGGFKRPY
jgi:hypothetical protein